MGHWLFRISCGRYHSRTPCHCYHCNTDQNYLRTETALELLRNCHQKQAKGDSRIKILKQFYFVAIQDQLALILKLFQKAGNNDTVRTKLLCDLTVRK